MSGLRQAVDTANSGTTGALRESGVQVEALEPEKIRATYKAPYSNSLTSRGPVAQRLEQWTHNPLVQGSNPCGPTTPPQ